MPSVSKAQAAMFARAASDPEFAKARGISQDVAREWHAADQATGDRRLPERATAPAKAAAPAKAKPVKLLGSR